tara:strand:+ start:4439 stop:5014 length:576 start_codon:yes stop_codon:yes gene_type:complete
MYSSWSPEGKTCSIPTILDQISDFPTHHVVLTGGEPMIAKGIHQLAKDLRDKGYHITIETAGTIAPEGIACDLASISPKLSHSTPTADQIDPSWVKKHDERRLQPMILRSWIEQGDYQLKFVTDGDDLVEIGDLLSQLGEIPAEKVLLMPEGITPEQLQSRIPGVIAACKERGFRFCPRLHIDLFGNTPGT